VKLKNPIPVVTMYVTAIVLESGEVHFFEDIYGEDAALEQELAEAGQEPETTSVEPGPRPRE
jgi:murein L,D-transpeptidase YcbB/YkuD